MTKSSTGRNNTRPKHKWQEQPDYGRQRQTAFQALVGTVKTRVDPVEYLPLYAQFKPSQVLSKPGSPTSRKTATSCHGRRRSIRLAPGPKTPHGPARIAIEPTRSARFLAKTTPPSSRGLASSPLDRYRTTAVARNPRTITQPSRA